MGNYQFEVMFGISDVIDVEAESYESALATARDEANSYYAVSVAGYSMPWDDIEIVCIAEPDEDDE